jgi:hypothetical protein
MIQFKAGNLLDETKMSEEEAIEFVHFLKLEIDRHKDHLRLYLKVAAMPDNSDFMRVVAQTVVIRNLQDIEMTKKTIRYLEDKFGME